MSKSKSKSKKITDDMTIDVMETYRKAIVYNLARMVTGNEGGEIGKNELDIIADAEEEAAQDLIGAVDGMVLKAHFRLGFGA